MRGASIVAVVGALVVGLAAPVIAEPTPTPPISAVLAAAYAAAGLDREPGGSWIARTRLAGLVPWMTVRATRDTSWQDTQSEVGHGTSLEVRATWRLDRLLFDGHELQVATIEAARRRERMRLASHVIRAYFAWRRATELAAHGAGEGATRGRGEPVTRGRDEAATPSLDEAAISGLEDRSTTRVAEATAELDALTDGWFSEELARPLRGGARGSRTR